MLAISPDLRLPHNRDTQRQTHKSNHTHKHTTTQTYRVTQKLADIETDSQSPAFTVEPWGLAPAPLGAPEQETRFGPVRWGAWEENYPKGSPFSKKPADIPCPAPFESPPRHPLFSQGKGPFHFSFARLVLFWGGSARSSSEGGEFGGEGWG